MKTTKNYLSSLFWGKKNIMNIEEKKRRERNSINLLKLKQREKREKKTCDTFKKMLDISEKKRRFEDYCKYIDWMQMLQAYNPKNELIQNKFI